MIFFTENAQIKSIQNLNKSLWIRIESGNVYQYTAAIHFICA